MELEEDNLLYRKLGLINERRLSLNYGAEHFRAMFERHIGEMTIKSYLSGPDHLLEGSLGGRTFSIRKPTWFKSAGSASAKGIIREEQGRLSVHLFVFVPMNLLLLAVFMNIAIGALSFYSTLNSDKLGSVAVILFSLFPILFLTYFIIGSSNEIKKLALQIEREFVFWGTQSSSN
jgi:hypothetical protein